MNTNFKILLFLVACSLCSCQQQIFSNGALNTYLTNTTLTKYYNWWTKMVTYAKNGATFQSLCYSDFRNVTSSSHGCTANCSSVDPTGNNCNSNCWPYVAPYNLLTISVDADNVCSSMQYNNGSNDDIRCTYSNWTYAGDPNNASFSAAVYENLTSNPQNPSNCTETNSSSYNSTYNDNQSFAGILQEIIAIDQWYLESLSGAIGCYPSPAQAKALYSNIWDEFYNYLIPLLQGHVTNATRAAPSLHTIFTSFWAQNIQTYTAPQTIIFEDLFNSWNGTWFVIPAQVCG